MGVTAEVILSSVPFTLVGATVVFTPWTQTQCLPTSFQIVTWPSCKWNFISLGPLFRTILFPGHISGVFSQGQDMLLPGTKQKSAVDGGYPAESAVRCDKLMAYLTLRCCQAARGGSCSMRDLLSLLRALIWCGNLSRELLRQCLRAPIPPKRCRVDGGGAETSCQWSPMDF